MRVAVLGSGQLASCLRDVVAAVHQPADVPGAQVVWAAEDTLVNTAGVADVNSVRQPIVDVFDAVADGALVLVSSQVPPGFTRELRLRFRQHRPNTPVSFAYLLENVKANAGSVAFLAQRGFVVGVFGKEGKAEIEQLLTPFGREWIFTDACSAEFTKTAINAMLATVIGLVNELGELANELGADPLDVERGMRMDTRLTHCPLQPGRPFANEHLGRDLRYLLRLADDKHYPASLISEVYRTNNERLRRKP